MLPKIKGKVAYVFDEADFDTDLICGMDTCTVADPAILKRVCMQDIAPDFQKYVEQAMSLCVVKILDTVTHILVDQWDCRNMESLHLLRSLFARDFIVQIRCVGRY